jgi:hypothetical protein
MRLKINGPHRLNISSATSQASRWLKAHLFTRSAYGWVRLNRAGVIGILVLMALAGIGLATASHAASSPSSGVLCTSGGANPTFSLTAKSGMISMPDGNTIYTWSYAPTSGAFQFPGPELCVNQGDKVTITLHNSLPEATSIMFPGMDGVQANGLPAQPESTGGITSMTTSAPAKGGSVTYTFTAANPGTYLYESGTDTGKQVQMGLYGALIVHSTATGAPAGAACAYDCTHSVYNPNNEYVMLLSDMDPALHQAVEQGQAYDVTQLHPRYWLINGRAFPDTIAPNNAAWLPAQPYSSLVHITVTQPNTSPPQALVRYLNAGQLAFPFHPHGENGTVIARDGSPLVTSGGTDLSYETFATTVGPGQTWDELYQYVDQEQFNPTSNPIPVTIPQLQNLTFKGNATYYSGSPYLGFQGPLPVGVTTYNECGEYYMVWHSHALYQVANYDTSFGGMLTLERIDPQTPAAGTTCTP